MIRQTRIHDGDAVAKALGRLVAYGNDFRSAAIDIAPSPLAFDARSSEKGSAASKRGSITVFPRSLINPQVVPSGGKERAGARRLLVTARGSEQRKKDRERDRAAVIHPPGKIL
jgi:hypothetical protein